MPNRSNSIRNNQPLAHDNLLQINKQWPQDDNFFEHVNEMTSNSYRLNERFIKKFSFSARGFFSSVHARKESARETHIFSTFRGYYAPISPPAELNEDYEELIYGVGIRALGAAFVIKESSEVKGKLWGFASAAASRQLKITETYRQIDIIGAPGFNMGELNSLNPNGIIDGDFVYKTLPELLKKFIEFVEKHKNDEQAKNSKININPKLIYAVPKITKEWDTASFIYALRLISLGKTLTAAKEQFENVNNMKEQSIDGKLSSDVLNAVYERIRKGSDSGEITPDQHDKEAARNILTGRNNTVYEGWEWSKTSIFFQGK